MSIKKNSIWNLVGAAIPIIIGLLCLPFLIKKIGIELFGILSLIWTLIGYFGLFDFGLGRALTQQVASHKSSGSNKNLTGVLITGLLITILMGLLGGVLLAIISRMLAYKWLNVSQEFQESVFYSFLIASIGIPLSTLTSGLKGILEGYEDFKKSNILRIVFGALNFLVPVLCVIFFKPRLEVIIVGLIITRLFILLLHFYFVIKKIDIRITTFEFNFFQSIPLLKYGAWMTVTNIIGPLMVVADRFIISSIIGANIVAYYTIPFDTILKVLIVPSSLTAALFPRIATLSKSNYEDKLFIYQRSIKILIKIMAPICLLIILFSKLSLKIWLGDLFADNSWIILSVLSIGIYFNSLSQLPFTALQAEGSVKITANLHVIEFLIYLPLLFISLNYLGLVGAAIIWAFRSMLDYFLMKYYYLKKINI